MIQFTTASAACVLELEPLEVAGQFHRLFERFRTQDCAVLLDSARLGGAGARCSFIGALPAAVLTARRPPPSAAEGTAELEWRVRGQAGVARRWLAEPFVEIERLLREWALPDELRAQIALPFVAGAVGYVGYDCARFVERLPDRAERDLDLPELCLLWLDAVLAHDHTSGTTTLATLGRGTDFGQAEVARLQLRAAVLEQLARDAPERTAAGSELPVVRAHAGAEQYAAMVRSAQAHILDGDAFEVCTAHRLEAAYAGDPFRLYEALREISPAGFACHVRTPWVSLLSSSPERFVRVDAATRMAESRPIKGTRPRGATPEADAALRAELEVSEKDRAENVMIVDLVRNDFGRVCEVDSIHVPELMIVEEHPRVFHMVSTIRGRLPAGVSPVALFASCFPPGSMTGAPKIEAMKIIEALERYKRGLYAGAVGYFDLGGGMDFSVVIRSFVCVGTRCCFSVGGAVVADSDPHAEYIESMDKARALLEALRAAGAP